MPTYFIETIISNSPLGYGFRVALVLLLTWLIAKVSSWLVARALTARSLNRQQHIRAQRLLTLRSLMSSAVKIFVYVIGFVVILLTLGIPSGSLVTSLALFSAGFGFAARPIISDYLSGVILIFEDQFAVGDKVEVLGIIGLVEAVDMRVTYIRSTTGELYIVPNGDVRVVRNLSRGLFSMATVKVTVATKDLPKAMEVLAQFADSAQEQVTDLIERPEFLSEEGTISTHVELTLSAKARYGRGARVRTRLMTLVTDAFDQAGVKIID